PPDPGHWRRPHAESALQRSQPGRKSRHSGGACGRSGSSHPGEPRPPAEPGPRLTRGVISPNLRLTISICTFWPPPPRPAIACRPRIRSRRSPAGIRRSMPGIAVDVRLATEAELEAVTALLVAQLREHRVQTPEAKIASAIQGLLRHPERGRILVAVGEGRPVGVAALSFAWPLEYADRSAWLEELYVEPAARGRGIGTRLLRAALRVAAEAGATVVDLEVEADHQRAARI